MSRPVALHLYLAASRLAGPVLRLLLARRARRGKEDPARLAERRGHVAADRPPGPLLWLHGASVGETTALLALIDALRTAQPGLGFVLTTGTLTAGKMLTGRLPQDVSHAYAPLDVVPWVRRFLDGWRPDLAVRIDSEIWPATLSLLAARGIPVVLVNARMSAASLRGWQRLPRLGRHLAGLFAGVAAQDAESAARLAAFGVPPGRLTVGGALKAAAASPAADPEALAALRDSIGARPVWLAASTHAPEESLALSAHAQATARMPDLLTLIVPRHPERGATVAAEAAARGLPVARRSSGQQPGGVAVYVADTMGEMGLWYRLVPFAFIGGSVAPMGGHNPYEPAALGVALAAGPQTFNFADAYAALDAAEAVVRTADATALGAAVIAALDPAGRPTAAATAAAARARAALAPDPLPMARAVALVLRNLPGAA